VSVAGAVGAVDSAGASGKVGSVTRVGAAGAVGELVEFPGPDGKKLVGILTPPADDVPKRNVLFVLGHGGLSHKMGANRVQHHLARYFAAKGCSVFRFDPAGLGDSDGDLETRARQDFFGQIESGLFRESYRRAFEYLAPKFPSHRWVVSGVCGGAISSLLGGVESPHPIDAFALISCPVILDGLRFDYARREPPAKAWGYVKLLLPKIFSPKAIWRFVSGQSDYGPMKRAVVSLLLRGTDKLKRLLPGAPKADAKPAPSTKLDDAKPATEPAPPKKPPIGLSPYFVAAAKQALKRSKVMFIYGDNDAFLWEFNELYAAANLSESQKKDVLRVVPHANHMFVWREWQNQAFDMIDGWLG
jgi:pimeloyl-ACP methyl ester carboxylesterase